MYAVAPALPPGLALNTVTGAITGTTVEPTVPKTYTVTTHNTGGSAVVTWVGADATTEPSPNVLLRVLDLAPSVTGFTSGDVVLTDPHTLVLGVLITPLVPVSTGGKVVAWSVTPDLPAGLSLSATTGVVSGTPAAATEASFTVVATNATGLASSSFTLYIPLPV